MQKRRREGFFFLCRVRVSGAEGVEGEGSGEREKQTRTDSVQRPVTRQCIEIENCNVEKKIAGHTRPQNF